MANRKNPVGVGLFEKKKDAGVTQHSPTQCGTVAPTDKKTQNLRASTPRGSKHRKYHGQQAK